MARELTLSGAKVFLHINGTPVGRVTSFSYTTNSMQRPIEVLDMCEPFELAPGQCSISGSVSVIKYMGDAGAEGVGMIPAHPEVQSGKYFSLLLLDRISYSAIFRADYCSVTGQSWNAPAKGYISGNIQFTALSWSNEIRSMNSSRSSVARQFGQHNLSVAYGDNTSTQLAWSTKG